MPLCLHRDCRRNKLLHLKQRDSMLQPSSLTGAFIGVTWPTAFISVPCWCHLLTGVSLLGDKIGNLIIGDSAWQCLVQNKQSRVKLPGSACYFSEEEDELFPQHLCPQTQCWLTKRKWFVVCNFSFHRICSFRLNRSFSPGVYTPTMEFHLGISLQPACWKLHNFCSSCLLGPRKGDSAEIKMSKEG